MSTATAAPATPLTQLSAWKSLKAHYEKVHSLQLRQLFKDDPGRGTRLTAEAEGIYLDYSKHRITDETLKLLLELAEESGLRARIDAMFRGDKINITEKRAVLHVALRAPKGEKIFVDGEDVVPAVHEVLDRMSAFSDRVRSGEWKGHTGKTIKNVINIGIGGSDLGPVMAYEALRHYSRRDMTFRFVSNVDGTDFAEATRDLDAEETLFIISSKTFTTLETMTNAHTARAWALKKLGDRVIQHCCVLWDDIRSRQRCQHLWTRAASHSGASWQLSRRRRRIGEHYGQRLSWQSCRMKEGNQNQRGKERRLQKQRTDREPFAACADASSGLDQTVFEHSLSQRLKLRERDTWSNRHRMG
jgi:hypothetical protein